MEFVDRCKDKLEHFRIKELKDILSRVGISKQGRKQDLVDRVLAVLYDEGSPFLYKHINGKEELVALIDDAHRKMKNEEANDSNAKKQKSASNKREQLQEEAEPMKIRCVCGHSGALDLPIQCADLNCNVWQHTGCALSSEKDIKKQSYEERFFCQTCRVERADPFWETIDHLLYPVKLPVSSIPTDGSKPFRSIEKKFEVSKQNRDLSLKAEYDVQVWCMLLSDSVPFRVQWPIYAELLVNGVPFRTYNRPGSQPLGANGRDDVVKITLYMIDGVNKICLSGCDDRDFCLGVRLVKKRTLQQVLSMIPLESVGESFEDALARIKRCAGGGMVAENEESDSDIEVVTDSITVSLRCPMSGCRMKTAGRFKPCVHMGCFDLETFIKMNERSRKWQCPVCLMNYSLENVTIDPYFNPIVNMMRDCREETSEIELKPDGSWRVKNEVAIKDLSLWHYPDGSLFASGPAKSTMNENLSPGKQENIAARSVGQPEDMSQLNLLDTQVKKIDLEVITMSSSSSEDDSDDAALSLKKEDEVNSCPPTRVMPQGNGGNNSSAQVNNADVIILSDSDEDDISIQHDSSTEKAGFDRSRISPTALISDPHPDDVRTIQTHDLDVETGFDQTPDIVSEHVDRCEMIPMDNGHSENQVLDPSLLSDEVLTSIIFPEDSLASAQNNLNVHIHSVEASVSGIMTPVQNPSPAEDGSYREGGTRYEGCNGNETRIQTTGTNQPEAIVYVRSKKRLSLTPNTEGESCLEADGCRKRAGDPFSFPRRQRSARRQ